MRKNEWNYKTYLGETDTKLKLRPPAGFVCLVPAVIFSSVVCTMVLLSVLWWESPEFYFSVDCWSWPTRYELLSATSLYWSEPLSMFFSVAESTWLN